MSCKVDHAGEVPKSLIELEDSQAGFWRHKCAGCAYLQGRRDAAAAEDRLSDRVRQLEADLLDARHGGR
jgi:hypothetical protein